MSKNRRVVYTKPGVGPQLLSPEPPWPLPELQAKQRLVGVQPPLVGGILRNLGQHLRPQLEWAIA